MIPIYTTYIHPSAKEIVGQTLDSTFISEGKKVKEFEDCLAKELGIVNPVAVNSGTAALHLACVLARISEGDEVILPAQTFVATALVVIQQGAIPVFADIKYNTGNIDPQSVKEKITEKTKAIIPVHWGGMPCDLDEILAIANEYSLTVIEDAAHAPGASYKSRMIGSISDYTCFSFQAIKHITTGDGGAVACLDNNKAQEAFTRRWFGIDRANSQPSILGERQYDIEALGFKYHLNDYGAALGLANLSDFKERLIHLRTIANYYHKELSNVPGIQLWDFPTDRESSWWLFGMHVENRLDFIKAMQEKGVTVSVVHQRIDHNSVFGGIKEDLISQQRFNETQIHIPLHSGITSELAAQVVASIKKGW
ncbi:MAG: DegT/DnrJ/EryC1/StrS family aminotransferase [Flavisolibacter sp.]|nr:DegT/DnrJ/EryC1/StrS family aminotransferase [Flavisolibacter sp.]